MLEQEEDRPQCARQIGKQVSTEQEVGGEHQERRSVRAAGFSRPVVHDTAEDRAGVVMREVIPGGLVTEALTSFLTYFLGLSPHHVGF